MCSREEDPADRRAVLTNWLASNGQHTDAIPEGTVFNFERLEAWKEAIVLADIAYDHTEEFPADERFGLTSQMRRAAVSVASNIAEGSSRSSRQDNARFVELATGSAYELVTQAVIATRRGFMTEEQYAEIYAAADKQSRINSGLRRSLLEPARP